MLALSAVIGQISDKFAGQYKMEYSAYYSYVTCVYIRFSSAVLPA